jgi:predicted transcriptional regulator
MKTAISIPEDVFRVAEELARRLGKSRSQLYSEAVAEYVRRHDQRDLTTDIDTSLARLGSDSGEFMREVARKTLDRAGW